jgi:Cdc6-related protein, AAA superfamily ATPase
LPLVSLNLELHHRDAQIRELALLARPAIQGGSPKNAILRGPPATGKHLDEAVGLAATIKKNFEELGV